MKKAFVILLLAVMLTAAASAQTGADYRPKGKSQRVSFSALRPLGEFSGSHIAGAGLSYGWSHYRFGDSVNAKKVVGFTATGGADYYVGKKLRTADYPFRYGNVLYAYLMPGIIYNPNAKSGIVLAGGPSLGLYKGSTNWGWGIRFTGSYHLSERIAAGPAVFYRKQAEANPLWSAGIQLSYTLPGNL